MAILAPPRAAVIKPWPYLDARARSVLGDRVISPAPPTLVAGGRSERAIPWSAGSGARRIDSPLLDSDPYSDRSVTAGSMRLARTAGIAAPAAIAASARVAATANDDQS